MKEAHAMKKFKVYCNHKDIEDSLSNLGLNFLERPGKIKENTLAVIVQYLEGDKEDTFEDVDLVIKVMKEKNVPVIVLDKMLVPQHSKDVWLKKNVVRYLPLDEPRATWAEVIEFLSQRMEHRRREIELQKKDTYRMGDFVKISPEDFSTYNLVSLFVGKMGDFMVELKYLLDAIRPKKIEDNPIIYLDRSRAMEFELALRHNKEECNFEKITYSRRQMEEFLDGEARELFDRSPDGLTRNHIIIEGETGTGKSIIADFIHQYMYQGLSEETRGELKPVNCANLGKELMESELFGSIKGAYTDAVTRSGAILEAYNGTLFLDEIGEVPLGMQAKLLSYIQSQRIHPTGWAGKGIYVPSLIVAATNRQLKEEVKGGQFRRDLHHRLGFTVTIPPMRDRVGDLNRLIDFVLQNPMINPIRSNNKHAVEAIERAGVESLKKYDFPGNFRELEQIIRRSVITAQTRGVKTITEENIKESIGC
jgi:transcriptional regulator of aromatic amino acid metabolism